MKWSVFSSLCYMMALTRNGRKDYQAKLSECNELLRQKDSTISELNGKNRVLELDPNRHIADIHNFKISLGSVTTIRYFFTIFIIYAIS